ncbi:hypothetical protein EVAR_57327_1 [Eumeta japonica]|uniref:Uncharacterized protein n=1 Tax=Eumeta variegata TaxID=151549 RepID=A0A4C2A1G3_EUMVA|nr:hypothetical protein EVAR_57327_1 [Eumeta japonica]
MIPRTPPPNGGFRHKFGKFRLGLGTLGRKITIEVSIYNPWECKANSMSSSLFRSWDPGPRGYAVSVLRSFLGNGNSRRSRIKCRLTLIVRLPDFPRNGPREKSRFMHVDAAWKDESDDHKKQRDHRLLLSELAFRCCRRGGRQESRKTMPRDYDAGARLGLCTLSPEDWAFFENVQYILDLIGAHAQYGESFSLNLFRY